MGTKDTLCQHSSTSVCPDVSYSKCPHCLLDLCLEHVLEHQLQVRLDFHQMIDHINHQKLISNDHSVINDMKAKTLEKLENWKTTKIELVMSVYLVEQSRIESTWTASIERKTKIQNKVFQELITNSNEIEKKKNVHPNDILQLKKKLNELAEAVREIEQDTNVKLTAIMSSVQLPEIAKQLKTQETLEILLQECENNLDKKNRIILKRENECQYLEQLIIEKDEIIHKLKQKLR
ncbi:unnamed protein product [Adineta ricciae]|uniref:Uncharacterized protein n=1 Tax=Adineta ricciae TaxID=249248 RepID=A0A814LTX7_ADIRI|nr:unnamed protein product [Adineta ricciae]CAF1552128.1 unnamed protein product [Adineta ricciae]